MRRFSFGQRIDNVSQRWKRFVDLLCLAQHFPLCSRLTHFLAARKINHCDFTRLSTSIFEIILMKSENKSHVWPWRCVVHIGVGHSSIADSFFEYLHGLFSRGNVLFSNVLNIDSFCLVLPYLQICLIWVQQVPQLLHVYLHHAHLYPELQIVRTTWYSLENWVHTTRKKSF